MESNKNQWTLGIKNTITSICILTRICNFTAIQRVYTQRLTSEGQLVDFYSCDHFGNVTCLHTKVVKALVCRTKVNQRYNWGWSGLPTFWESRPVNDFWWLNIKLSDCLIRISLRYPNLSQATKFWKTI